MERDVTALVVPTIGAVASIDAAPGTVMLDATGEPVEEVSEFFATMVTCGARFSSLRSYGLALLRWWRFLAAIEVHWQRAGRIEARDFVLWLRLVGPAGRQSGYAPATINHAIAVVKMFYADRIRAGDGPLINPVPEVDRRADLRRSTASPPTASGTSSSATSPKASSSSAPAGVPTAPAANTNTPVSAARCSARTLISTDGSKASSTASKHGSPRPPSAVGSAKSTACEPVSPPPNRS